MRDVHIRIENFYQVVEVTDRVINEPAFLRLRVRPRESKRDLDNILPLDECMSELMTRWEEDGEAEGADAA